MKTQTGDSHATGVAKSTKEDWLNLAIELLIRDGIDRVKVQVMARELAVARSSFYWFFDSPKDLHQKMLDVWLSKNTGPIIQRALRPATCISEAILNVFECWVDRRLFDPQLDVAVRLWARRSDDVLAIVESSDLQRVEALARMFDRYGFSSTEALTRARVLYFTQIGQYTLNVIEEDELRLSRARDYVVAFSGEEPAPALLESFAQKARIWLRQS